MLDSKDVKLPEPVQAQAPAEYVKALFERFLCRPPGPQESAAFTAELQSNTAPRMLVRALLTHWDYQHY